MNDSNRSRRRLACLAAFAVCAVQGVEAQSASLSVLVSNREGQPVEEVVVYAVAVGLESADAVTTAAEPLVMNQQNEQFEPHILVAQLGSTVSFPNSDSVSHHVYSFSAPKQFELPLYQGMGHPPVTFDEPGIVDVGCNIHDHMEAHIVIVDTPYFATTGADGQVMLSDLPDGAYAVQVYSPRLRTVDHPAPQHTTLAGSGDTVLRIQLEGRLRPPHSTENESLNWSRY